MGHSSCLSHFLVLLVFNFHQRCQLLVLKLRICQIIYNSICSEKKEWIFAIGHCVNTQNQQITCSTFFLKIWVNFNIPFPKILAVDILSVIKCIRILSIMCIISSDITISQVIGSNSAGSEQFFLDLVIRVYWENKVTEWYHILENFMMKCVLNFNLSHNLK